MLNTSKKLSIILAVVHFLIGAGLIFLAYLFQDFIGTWTTGIGVLRGFVIGVLFIIVSYFLWKKPRIGIYLTLALWVILVVFHFLSKDGYLPKNIPSRSSSSVSWQKAVELIRTCQVKTVYQTHSLDVSLRLADGSKVSTQEPKIDQVVDEIEKASDKCGDIPIATE